MLIITYYSVLALGVFGHPILTSVQRYHRLQYLHSMYIVHRDIKPANILKAGDIVKLADFGSAKSIRHEDTHTGTGGLDVGTVAVES